MMNKKLYIPTLFNCLVVTPCGIVHKVRHSTDFFFSNLSVLQNKEKNDRTFCDPDPENHKKCGQISSVLQNNRKACSTFRLLRF